MEPINIDLNFINPPLSLVKKWAMDSHGRVNPSLYMRECYLQYGVQEGARLMREALREWVLAHEDELVDIDELFDAFSMTEAQP
jgi:hypothetical protein